MPSYPCRSDAITLVPMSVPATERGVSLEAWLSAEPGWLERIEVVDGELVVKRIGGNPHHQIARRLANEFERQWPEVSAAAPAYWAIQVNPDGNVITGRIPDVLVDGDSLDADAAFVGVPHAAVEVWSPGNTLAEMNEKRSLYRQAGLPVFVEAFLTDAGDVHLDWLVREERRWVSEAAAAGDTELVVSHPRPFRIVPNSLLRRPPS
jgi:Uma2 family endonuclease